MNRSDRTNRPPAGIDTKTRERQLVKRLQQSLKEEELERGGRILVETSFQISDAIGWLRRTDPRTAELRMNLYALRRALRMGKRWGDRVDDLFFFYLLAFVRLSRTAIAGTCGSYAEGLAVCAYALRTERDHSSAIPIPMMLRGFAKRREILADAVYCEAEAVRQTDLCQREAVGAGTEELASWADRAEELRRWASMPEIVYAGGGVPHMAALYIADGLDQLLQNSAGCLDKYPLIRPAGSVSSVNAIRPVWKRAALSEPGSFYDKISLRILGSDPEAVCSEGLPGELIGAAAESGTAEEFLRAAVHYTAMCGGTPSRVLGENRIAVERIADGIRRLLDENGHELRCGSIHSLGFL